MELTAQASALLGTGCRPGECSSSFPCAGHPLVTCQLTEDTDEGIVFEPARIVNASKGDLYLGPGSSLGFVGTILGALRPSQHYTHMGIVIDDGLSIRHATASSDRLKLFPYGEILGTGAPTRGFAPDQLRFGWPGTITQTVDIAWALTIPGQGDDRNKWIEDPDLLDPDTGAPLRFKIDALSFDPVPVLHRRDEHSPAVEQVRLPLLVKPCPRDEAHEEWLRPLLHRVADEVKAIRGHYRFYAYSDARIALDPGYEGPAVYEKTMEVRDPDTGECEERAVESTIPVMCSSLVWAAIERIRRDGADILLEWSDDPDWSPECVPTVSPESAPPDGAAPEDGLYMYSPAQRLAGGEALHSKLVEDVRGTVEEEIPFVLQAAGIAISGPALIAVLAGGEIGAILGPGVSGITADAMAKAAAMPGKVANQMCNAFASDHCETEAIESEAWRDDPGEGRSVSPDDLAIYWDAPAHGERGLYGYNEPAILRPARRRMKRPSVWTLSEGTGRLSGIVWADGNRVEGARVRVACKEAVTQDEGYQLVAPNGNYLATAGWRDPATGWWWESEREVTVPLDGDETANFELSPPRRAFRCLYLTGKADLVDEVPIGHDWVMHPPISGRNAYLGPFMIDLPGNGRKDSIEWRHPISDVGFARIRLDFTRTAYPGDADADGEEPYTVDAEWWAGIWDDGATPGDDEPEVEEHGVELLDEDGSGHWVVDLDSGLWAQRVHMDFTVENRRAA